MAIYYVYVVNSHKSLMQTPVVMRKVFTTLFISVSLALSAVPTATAQRHAGANGGRQERREQSSSSSRVQQSSSSRVQPSRTERQRPQTVQGSRPGVSSGSNHQQPAVSGNNSNTNNGHNQQRPAITGNEQNRPGVGTAGNRPGVSTGGNRPAPAPSAPAVRPNPSASNWAHATPPGHGRPVIMQPVHRPNRPVMMRPQYRPVPPPAWRPAHRVPLIHGILGLTFGTAFNVSLDYLFNNGFIVDGYVNDVVYLRNVPVLNYIWTDGALYYGANGLDVTSFYYSTPVYDMTRYNNVYRGLVTSYGAPVSAVRRGGVVTSTWFGGNNGYITLSFGSANGRYLTTLTMGV